MPDKIGRDASADFDEDGNLVCRPQKKWPEELPESLASVVPDKDAAEYAISGNPILPLKALVLAARHNASIPDWVCRYLGTDVAPRLINGLDELREEQGLMKIRNQAEFIGKAFGFSTSRGPKNDLQDNYDEAWHVYDLVSKELRKHSKEYLAFQAVSEIAGLSESTVRRRYKLVSEFIENLAPPDLSEI